MAITNTRTVERIEVYPPVDSSAAATTNDGNVTIMVVYQNLFDDANDDALPVTSKTVKILSRFTVVNDVETSTATDVTGEDQLVQDVCGAIWS